MKIQLNLDNPKAIMLYELLEKKMKSKSFEYALVLLAQDEVSDIYFGYENAKKAQEIIQGITDVENIQKNKVNKKIADNEEKNIVETKESSENIQIKSAAKPYKIEL